MCFRGGKMDCARREGENELLRYLTLTIANKFWLSFVLFRFSREIKIMNNDIKDFC